MKQDVRVELFYAGVWNGHTSSALVRDQIKITRGRADESQQPAPVMCKLSFSGWRFNPANPGSDLFGLIGRNTPLRVSVGASVRFVGEVASWSPRQSLGGPNVPSDRWVEVEAAGLTRRLGQGADPLRDTVRRFITDVASENLVGYWPLDDPDGSRVGRAIVGADMRPEAPSALPEFGQGRLHPWLPPTAKLTSKEGSLTASLSGATPGGFEAVWLYRADELPNDEFPVPTEIRVPSDNIEYVVTMGQSGADDLQVRVLDDGVIIGSVNVTAGIEDGNVYHIRFRVDDTTGNFVNVFVHVNNVEVIANSVDIGVSTPAPADAVRLRWFNALDQAAASSQLGQLAIWDDAIPVDPADVLDAYNGRQGEHAGRRIERLCGEQGIAFVFSGDLDDTLPCGPQYPDGFLAILREAAAVDGGDLLDARTGAAIGYDTGRTRYNQAATLALDYGNAEVAPPLNPKVLDDQSFRNDVTAKRRDGGEARKVDQDSIDTVGRAATSVTVNPMSDEGAGNQAGWRLHLGTVQGTRFPQITVDLDASPALTGAASGADAGHRLTIVNLPAELTPDLASLLVLGYVETIGSHRRKITFNCVPEVPYHIAEVEHLDFSVIGSEGTAIALAGGDFEAGTDTEMEVDLLFANIPWTHEIDFDIIAAGVRLRVTAVGAPGAGGIEADNQILTVDQTPVNGVAKTIPSGTPVDVFHQSYIGL